MVYGCEPAIDMRKGEPKVDQEDWPVSIQGENATRPGAATRYLYARRLIAGRHHAPAFNPGSVASTYSKAVARALDQSKVQSRVTGWETQCGYAVGAWGNLCQANLPL